MDPGRRIHQREAPGLVAQSELDGLGAKSFVFLVDRAKADSPAAAGRLESATGIWFTGGDQALLTDAIGGTASLRAMHRRYREGAVVGGTCCRPVAPPIPTPDAEAFEPKVTGIPQSGH